MHMFAFLKNQLHKIFSSVTTKLSALFGRSTIDDAALQELERILIEADAGVSTTRECLNQLRALAGKAPMTGAEAKEVLARILKAIVAGKRYEKNASIFLMVGVNGTGKTSFAAKLAARYKREGKKVLLVAADTFRAAAQEQLSEWASKIGIPVVVGKQDQDPASVVFTGCTQFKNDGYDILIIDTAGRLQNKINLMNELAKIKSVIGKVLPDKMCSTLLTVDAMLGQNSFEQAKIFNQICTIDGVVLTKMDGTGKGGIVFAITKDLNIPVAYVAFGERLEDMELFDPDAYVREFFEA